MREVVTASPNVEHAKSFGNHVCIGIERRLAPSIKSPEQLERRFGERPQQHHLVLRSATAKLACDVCARRTPAKVSLSIG